MFRSLPSERDTGLNLVTRSRVGDAASHEIEELWGLLIEQRTGLKAGEVEVTAWITYRDFIRFAVLRGQVEARRVFTVLI